MLLCIPQARTTSSTEAVRETNNIETGRYMLLTQEEK